MPMPEPISVELRRLLEDQRVESRLLQRDRRRHPGDSATDHQDAHHDPASDGMPGEGERCQRAPDVRLGDAGDLDVHDAVHE